MRGKKEARENRASKLITMKIKMRIISSDGLVLYAELGIRIGTGSHIGSKKKTRYTICETGNGCKNTGY